MTRENQIKRVVEKLSDEFWADADDDGWHAMGWDEYYDLTIYPISNDIYDLETDRQIRFVLGEEPYEEGNQ